MASTPILEMLDRGMRSRLTLILTPDGSPEVLRRWLEERPWPLARVVLTAADNGVERFLMKMRRSVRPLIAGNLPAAGEASPLEATTEMLNALMEVGEDFVVILEDYDVITAPAVHAAVEMMVAYPPPQMHLYVVSRSVPPLPLPRLRVRQQLVEIDLRHGEVG